VAVRTVKKKNEIVVKDEEQGIKDLLKDAGLLQYDNSEVQSVNGFKFSSRSSFKSYSEKNDSDNQFCTNNAI
jgi:UDP-N-acetylglucosamine transferase subunit ALG13